MKKTDKQKLEQLMLNDLDKAIEQMKAIELEPSSTAGDMGDMAQDLAHEHTKVLLKERLNKRIWELKDALKRINDADFGICEDTGEAIDFKRLLLVPTTRLTTAAAQKREREASQRRDK